MTHTPNSPEVLAELEALREFEEQILELEEDLEDVPDLDDYLQAIINAN
jgi:cell fate (sporulation/competence/biofilm development) regulator YmcA (YheA/YmcA/DUF963 family)